MLGNIIFSTLATIWAYSAIIAINFNFIYCDVYSKYTALEDLINGLGLICSYRMAGLEDMQEWHITMLANKTADIRGIGIELGVFSCIEG